MRTLVKALASAAVLVATVAAGGRQAQAAPFRQCLHDHGVDTTGAEQYPNGIGGLPIHGPDTRAAITACTSYGPITGVERKTHG
jgi:hypothetical protein